MLFSHISRESYVCNLYEIIGEVCLCACVCTWWPHSAVKSLNPPAAPLPTCLKYSPNTLMGVENSICMETL